MVISGLRGVGWNETRRILPNEEQSQNDETSCEPMQTIFAYQGGHAGSLGDAQVCFVEHDFPIGTDQPGQ